MNNLLSRRHPGSRAYAQGTVCLASPKRGELRVFLAALALLAGSVLAQPATDHPRLWIRSGDLTELRSRAVGSNPLWADGLAPLAVAAKQQMDDGLVPGADDGGITWEQYPTEMYAELFAFLSLVDASSSARADYAQRARTLLMHIIDQAAPGQADAPFRYDGFSTYDRSRWWGEAFGLTVDWIYPTLSAQDKATIRLVFLRWCAENKLADTTDYNHPEPVDVFNDPALLADPMRVRWSINNYYLAHLRNVGLMALSFDAGDDPGGELTGYLETATGAFLYVTDHLLRNQASGGFSPEGFQYGPDALGFLAHFLLALHTSGQDDPLVWGPQVVWAGHPFWEDVAPAFLHSLSPARVTYPDTSWIGEVYQPAWYGDGQEYWLHDAVSLFAPMGLHADSVANSSRSNAARWIQLHTPPGGVGADPWADLADRMAGVESFRDAILYFVLFDPDDPLPTDPRNGLAKAFHAPGTGRLLARTGWAGTDSLFTFYLGSAYVDHQLAEGGQIELYRGGEWMTKGRVGWDGASELCTIGRSDYHNTLAVENAVGDLTPSDWLYGCQQNGSQFMQVPDGEGEILAVEVNDEFVYVQGEATDLYNSSGNGSTSVAHVSRSLVWLNPDQVVVYDRAETTAPGFKRFWLNLPATGTLTGSRLRVDTPGGQRLFVHALQPAGALQWVSASEPLPDEVALEEPMSHRYLAEASGEPSSTRFLHVIEGADGDALPTTATLVESTSGTAYAGAIAGSTAVLFPVSIDAAFTDTGFVVPETTDTVLLAGLEPVTGYSVSIAADSGGLAVSVLPGGSLQTGTGGVLRVDVEIHAQGIIFADRFQ